MIDSPSKFLLLRFGAVGAALLMGTLMGCSSRGGGLQRSHGVKAGDPRDDIDDAVKVRNLGLESGERKELLVGKWEIRSTAQASNESGSGGKNVTTILLSSASRSVPADQPIAATITVVGDGARLPAPAYDSLNRRIYHRIRFSEVPTVLAILSQRRVVCTIWRTSDGAVRSDLSGTGTVLP